MARYTYAKGYKTPERAQAALEDCFAEGSVSPGERPEVQPYSFRFNGKRVRRWEITLAE